MSSGRIITFYSYKGGVGRTMALANVAAVLAGWGHRVLCIDWDLEAPGLDRYLQSDEERRQSPGLVDLITAFADGEPTDWRHHLSVTPIERVDLIHAGREDSAFLERMQAIDWHSLYAERGLGEYIEETLRAQWCAEYDFVLVDSRTGVTDTGGICTAQLPDIIVALFTANNQSFEGALRVIELADQRRDQMPFDRPRALMLPVISRFEIRVEYEQAQKWLERFDQGLAEHLRLWVDPSATADMLAALRVPYVPYWSFGERVAVTERGVGDPDDVGHAYETIAALLEHGLLDSDRLLKARDEYVMASRRSKPSVVEAEDDVLILAGRSDVGLATSIQQYLENEGFQVSFVEDSPIEREHVRNKIRAALNYIFIIGPDWHSWREHSVEDALAMQQASEQPRRLVPLIRKDVNPDDMPRSLRHLVAVREHTRPKDTKTDLVRLLNPPRGQTDGTKRPPEDMGLIELIDAIQHVGDLTIDELADLDAFLDQTRERCHSHTNTLNALWNDLEGRARLAAASDSVANQLASDSLALEQHHERLKSLVERLRPLLRSLTFNEVMAGYPGGPEVFSSIQMAAERTPPDLLGVVQAIPAMTARLRLIKRAFSTRVFELWSERKTLAQAVQEVV